MQEQTPSHLTTTTYIGPGHHQDHHRLKLVIEIISNPIVSIVYLVCVGTLCSHQKGEKGANWCTLRHLPRGLGPWQPTEGVGWGGDVLVVVHMTGG